MEESEINILNSALAEQRDYYNARAPEYDEWWLRRGRFNYGPEANARWHEETATLHKALDSSGISGDVLELASGTGTWTVQLARLADRVVALDGSAEMIAINRARLESGGLTDRITFQEVDLFKWKPDRTFDAAVTGFFLSHVPLQLEDDFIEMVASALRPDGKFFFVDSRREQSSTAPDQPLPDEGDQIMTRKLNDGRSYQIVKLYRSTAEMTDLFARHGLEVNVRETPNYFQYGLGRKRS